MAKHVLTFFIVFLGLMLLFKSCSPKKELPPAVPEYSVTRPAEGQLAALKDSTGKTVVELAPDGSVVSVSSGKVPVLRSMPSWSRAFHLLLVGRDRRKNEIPVANWTSEALPGGKGRIFRGKLGELTVEKRVRLAEDGRGLDCTLAVKGAGQKAISLWLTLVSGVALPERDDENRTGVFWMLPGGKPQLISRESLVAKRETERAQREKQIKEGAEHLQPRPAYALHKELPPGGAVARYGVLGTTHEVAVEQLPEVSELQMDVYRARRPGAGASTGEIEAWTVLIPRDGAYAATFRMRWRKRDAREVQARFAGLFERSQTYLLEDQTFRAELTDRGAAIKAMWLKSYSTVAGEKPQKTTWIPILRPGTQPEDRALSLHGNADLYGGDPARRVWKVDRPTPRSIRFFLETRRHWRIRKTITLPEPGRYDLRVGIEVERPPESKASVAKFTLVGPAGSYIADAYRGIIGAGQPSGILLERSGGDDDDEKISKLAKGEDLTHDYGPARQGLLKAVALRGAYFVSALVLDEQRDSKGLLTGCVTQATVRAIKLEEPIERDNGESSKESMRGEIVCLLPLPAGRGTLQARLYAGPNNPPDLKRLDIDATVDYGIFEIIGRGLMALMNFFYGLLGSYGVAIMLMTVVVRSVLLPVSYKTQLGMQHYQKRLAKIKPILDGLEKKYGKKSQKLNQERMRVMREHKVGFPLGCLTMFLQIPIWFALFQALRVEFSLRHQSFLWAIDLSMPDRLFALPFWPHQFNFFPILMLVLWVAQQKVAPQAGSDDPQVKTQMKMMKFMPFMFFFMLYKYAAALAIYMCVSSAWGIVEGKLVRRAIARADS